MNMTTTEEFVKMQELIVDVMTRAQERLQLQIPYECGEKATEIVEDGESHEITRWLHQPLVGLLMDWDPDPTMAAVTEAYKELKQLHMETDGMDPQTFNYCVLEWLAREYGIR